MFRAVITFLFITTIINVALSINVQWFTKYANDTNALAQGARDSFLVDLECYNNGTRKISPLALNDQETKLLKSVVDVKMSLEITKAKAREAWMTPLIASFVCVTFCISLINFGAGADKTLKNILKVLNEMLSALETIASSCSMAALGFLKDVFRKSGHPNETKKIRKN